MGMNDNKERQILGARLAKIDRRRAELEVVMSSLPPRLDPTPRPRIGTGKPVALPLRHRRAA
jgi:hypothetical protein